MHPPLRRRSNHDTSSNGGHLLLRKISVLGLSYITSRENASQHTNWTIGYPQNRLARLHTIARRYWDARKSEPNRNPFYYPTNIRNLKVSEDG